MCLLVVLVFWLPGLQDFWREESTDARRGHLSLLGSQYLHINFVLT